MIVIQFSIILFNYDLFAKVIPAHYVSYPDFSTCLLSLSAIFLAILSISSTDLCLIALFQRRNISMRGV